MVLSDTQREYIYQLSKQLQADRLHRPLLIDDADLGWKIFFWCHCLFYEQVEGYEGFTKDDAKALLENITFDFKPSSYLCVNWFNALCFYGSPLAVDFYVQNKDVLDMPYIDPGLVFLSPSRFVRGITISLLHSGSDEILKAFISRFHHLFCHKNVLSIIEGLPFPSLKIAKRCFEKNGLSLPVITIPRIAVKHIPDREWFPRLTEDEVLGLLLDQDELYYDDLKSIDQLRSKFQKVHPSF